MVVGLLTELDLWLGETFASLGVVGSVLRLIYRFGVVMVVFGVWAVLLEAIAIRTFFSPSQMEPTLGRFASRLFQVFVLIIGLVTATAVLDVDLFAVATSFGLVGLGLSLGLQNTVANVMSGISMAMDRPFTVGDRIQVGEFWGEVEEIGLRSVRILTARREYVIIPNRIMDEREIWNYTIQHPELRVDIEIPISYESDVDLAESIALKAAADHPMVLSFPKPRVLARDLGDHGMNLELWVFVRNARERYEVESDLLRQIKRGFDEKGVEIPYPREVDLRYEDLPERGRVPERTEPQTAHTRPTVLAPSAGERPARERAAGIVDVAEELGARLLVVHAVERLTETTRQAGEHAVRPILQEARERGIEAEPMVLQGGLEEVVSQLVATEGVDVMVVGEPWSLIQRWRQGDTPDRLQRRLGIPNVAVDEAGRIDREDLAVARAEIRDRYGTDEPEVE